MNKTSFKKLFAKMTACVMAIMMLSAPLGIIGFADNTDRSANKFTDVTDNYAYKEQIEILSGIGVIMGTGENRFSPDVNVTREQMALFLFRLMLGRSTAGDVNSTNFDDLYDGTYTGAISWANASGYILGTSDTTFDPTGGIKLQDAFTMIVRALGYNGSSNAQMDKGYPWTYIEAASKLGLDRGLEKLSYQKVLTRGEIAALMFNALTADYKIALVNGNGGVYYETTSIIESVFGYELESGILTATNTLAIDGNATVIKTGYVSFALENGENITVDFSKLGLSGTPEQWLMRKLNIIYSKNDKTGAIEVLGASYNGKSETILEATLSNDGRYVTLGANTYRVVEKKSDLLGTNANELIVYMHTGLGTLAQVKSTAELASHLGFFSIELIYDGGETASRAILKPYSFGKLEINDGKFNLAGNLTAAELKGGLYNLTGAGHGDYVLYHFNSHNKRLEVAEKLTVLEGKLVTKLTDTTAVVGGIEYKLGNEAAGITAASVKAQLPIGSNVNIITRGGTILGTTESAAVTQTANYLVLLSAPVPVYLTDNGIGGVKYVASANIGGNITNIFVNNNDINSPVNKVYRYTVQDGIYALTGINENGFTISGELSVSDTVAENTKIEMNNNAHFTFGGKNFVTDESSVIIVKNGESYEIRRGIYSGEILLRAGAEYTAILRDEIGSVETLRFLYVTDGGFENSAVTEHSVKILAKLGTELVDGEVMTEYSAYSFADRAVKTFHSVHDNLEIGGIYVLGSDGYLSDSGAKNVINGLVTGFTASTVTVGGTTYALDTNFKALSINGTEVKEIGVSNLYLSNVELIVSGTKAQFAVHAGAAGFRAERAENGINMIANDATKASLENAGAGDIELVRITADGTDLDIENAEIAVENGVISITNVELPEAAEGEAGAKIRVTISVFSIAFNAEIA